VRSSHRAGWKHRSRVARHVSGARVAANEFGERGIVAAVHGRGPAADVIVARLECEPFLKGRAADALHEAVAGPALAEGYRQVWLFRIQLGGVGVLLYASRYQDHVEGLGCARAFFGAHGTIDQIATAGRVASQRAPRQPTTVIEGGHVSLAAGAPARAAGWPANSSCQWPSPSIRTGTPEAWRQSPYRSCRGGRRRTRLDRQAHPKALRARSCAFRDFVRWGRLKSPGAGTGRWNEASNTMA
jgi:hypothetical protein